MASSPQQQQMASPFKLFLTPSHSAPDIGVQGLVDRFNTLEVKDMDEEKTQRQMRRLEAALRRAEMAREEAESEARTLRDELRDQRDMAEEKHREKVVLRERLDEYEKKYDKAKDRFRAQKVKHEEQMRKMTKDYMEREKLHWRQEQLLQEEVEWERKLRNDANDLVAFLDIERTVALQCLRDTPAVSKPQSGPEIQEPEMDHQQQEQQQEEENTQMEQEQEKPQDIEAETETMNTEPPQQQYESTNDHAIEDDTENLLFNRPDSPQTLTTTTTTKTTSNPTLKIPINFNDEDKENTLPRTPSRHVSAPPHHLLKTPLTISCSTPFSTSKQNVPDFLNTPIDRAAALAAIQYRRGRARSNGAGTMTTPKVGMLREKSEPPMGVMSVGRKSRA